VIRIFFPVTNSHHLALFRFQTKILGKDLLDIVASHFKLKEKEYFGIAYKSERLVS